MELLHAALQLLEPIFDDDDLVRWKVTSSSGNVFWDLGFPADEAEHLLIRADLLIHLQRVIAARKLKQGAIANLLHVTQHRVSDLLRGLKASSRRRLKVARSPIAIRVLRFPASRSIS